MKSLLKKTTLAIAILISNPLIAEEQLSFSENMCVSMFKSPDSRNLETMMDYCQGSAEEGQMISSALLGQIYMHGVKGAPRSPDDAYKWTKKAADKGHIPSISELGRMTLLGFGAEANFNEAGNLFDKAILGKSGSGAYYKSIWYLTEKENNSKSMTTIEETMSKVCEMNLIAIDYGYTAKRNEFNILMKSIMNSYTDNGQAFISKCTSNVLAYHKEHNDQFLYANAGQPIKEERKMPNGPYPITSPEFWLNILAPK